MPVNFPPAGPPLEKVRGLDASRGQFEAVLNLLLHYDWYLRRRLPIPSLVHPGGLNMSSPGGERRH